VTGLALVVLTGLVHGFWTGRWQQSRELKDAVARLDRVPLQAGPWQGRAQEADAEPFARAGASRYWVRQYADRRTGRAVTVILMCGRAGPMSVHTPDVCYRGAGFEVVAGPEPFRLSGPGGETEWRTLRARQGGPVPVDLRVCWAWTADGDWRAPEQPRLAFRGAPALYKLYVLRETAPAEGGAGEGPCREFLRDFLPDLRRALFPAADPLTQPPPPR
jgi:hypothetical protein